MSKKNKKIKKNHNFKDINPENSNKAHEDSLIEKEGRIVLHESNTLANMDPKLVHRANTPDLKIPDQEQSGDKGLATIYTKEFASRIYDKKKYMQRPKSDSFFSKVKDVIFADIVWQSVAISLLAGIIIFYFFGLQPLVLANYTDQAKSQIFEIKTNYTVQTNSFKKLQLDLFAMTKPIDLGEKCFANQSSPFTTDSFAKIETLQRQNLPPLKLTQLPSYNAFSQSDIKDIYSSAYSQYENSLASYNTAIKELREAISFLNWRGDWIKACSNISNSNTTLGKLSGECSDLIDSSKDLESNQNRFLINSKQSIQMGLDLCQEIVSYKDKNPDQNVFPNYSRWQIQWLGELERVVKISVSVADTVDNLQKIDSNLANNLNQASLKIDEQVSNKSSFVDHFYLLELSL